MTVEMVAVDEAIGRAARRRVYREFLVLSQLGDWLKTLASRLDM